MLAILESIHSLLPTVLWVSLLILGLWGVYRASQKQELKGVFLTAVMTAQIGIILQAVLGVVLMIVGDWPTQGFLHIGLGAAASVFLFGVNAYLRGSTNNQAQWRYSAGVILLFGVALLATFTG